MFRPRIVLLYTGLLLSLAAGIGPSATADDFDFQPPPAVPLDLPRIDARLHIKQNGRVGGLAFAPDGQTLAVADSRGFFGLWSVRTGKAGRPVREFPVGMLGLAYAPDGKAVALAGTVALAAGDGNIELWDTAADKPIRTLKGHDDQVWAVAFSPDGTKLASASSDRSVRLWEVATGKQVLQMDGHKSWVQSLAFSPDGKQLVTGSRDQSARLWDLESGKELRKLVTPESHVWAVAFSPDGRTAVVGGGDNKVRFWDTATGKTLRELEGHTQRVWGLAFTPNGRMVASASEDHTVRVWETITGRPVAVLTDHTDSVMSVAFDARGRTLAAGSDRGQVCLWDLFDAPASSLSADDLQRVWKDLGGDNAGRARTDICRLVASPKETVSFFQDRLQPVPEVEPAQLKQLIADLDSDKFAARKKAADELERLAEVAEPAMRKALADGPSLELQRRLNDLLKPLETLSPPPERLRPLRAVQVLEDIGTADARELLEKLSKGSPDSLLTKEAQGAVRRLSKRTS